jgi:hypothetical protein
MCTVFAAELLAQILRLDPQPVLTIRTRELSGALNHELFRNLELQEYTDS